MPGTSVQSSISVSNSPPGTGISSTWCGCSCSPASTFGVTARKAWPTGRIDRALHGATRGGRKGAAPFVLWRAPDAAQRHKRVYARLRRAMRCAADAGPTELVAAWVPALRSSVKDAAPRPGHGSTWLKRKSKSMPDPMPPTLAKSALRGLACKCPRCGQGKLYAGFLTLAPRCESCGLDYAFIDSGDGPAIFIIMLAGAIVVACALIVEVKFQPPFWLHAVLWLPLILATTLLPLRAMKALLIALQFHHNAAPGRLIDREPK